MNSARVLVVDDDPGILRSVRSALVARGYIVRALDRAADVASTAAQDRPDVILLDLMLPDGDGLALCRELRASSDVPIIVLSAIGDDAVKVQALDDGADDYLEKPFSLEELLARVRVSLRRRAGLARELTLRAGPIELNIESHEVAVSGKPLHLTVTEFALLRMLMEDRGRLLTHRMLLTAIWGADYANDTHILRTFVYQLRTKLSTADAAAGAMIATDPRVGYRLVRDEPPPGMGDPDEPG